MFLKTEVAAVKMQLLLVLCCVPWDVPKTVFKPIITSSETGYCGK